MIQNIAIEKLHEHPDNPRKNVGDVTELAESIKQSGVLQNLTVVPAHGYHFGDYTVLIGHRRLAAAKLAGLKELPCAIVEMEKKDQIATMLLENMQRSDLTVYEQAQGMQMMMDLGDSVTEISEKTGFSESTIRRRVKLLELDAEKFKESESRQVSMAEYDRLFEIEDKDTRNELLEHIGTANFNNALSSAKDKKARKEKQDAIVAELSKYATETTHGVAQKLKWVKYIYNAEEVPKDYEDANHYFTRETYGSSVGLYREYTEEEKRKTAENERKREEDERLRDEAKERRAQLDALSNRFRDLRRDFVKTCGDLRKKLNILSEFAAWSLVSQDWINGETLNLLVGDEVYKGAYEDNSAYAAWLQENAYKGLLYSAYAKSGNPGSYHDYYGNPKENKELDILYDYLIALGYEMSNEEKAYKDGTHELLRKVDAE